MKKLLFFILICLICIPSIAQKSPKWIEKAGKAMFTIDVYDKNGNIRSGNGFYIGPSGEGISDYTLFIGAVKAIITDAEGNKKPVKKILGADELYDVIRFLVESPQKVSYLTPVKNALKVGTEAYLLPSGYTKNMAITKSSITEVTKVKDNYEYYQLDVSLAPSQVSFPLLTAEGEVFAIAQVDVTGKNKTYGISISYIQDIQVSAMDLFNSMYSSIDIQKSWPSSAEDAQVALLIYGSNQDAQSYLLTLNDFIKTFPDYPDGYLDRASHYVFRRKELDLNKEKQENMLNLAYSDLETYSKYNHDIADAYYNQAKLIFNVSVSDSTLISDQWSLEAAENKLKLAIEHNNLPLYHQLEGDIAFIKGDYQKALHAYMIVNESPVASSESFYSAAKAKQLLPGVNFLEVIALIDSAVIKSPSPSEAILYLQENIDLKSQFGQHEALVKDYDLYYYLSGGNVTDAFYYYREQAKFRSGDLDGALTDIDLAIEIDPNNPIYYAEKGSIYLRLQDLQKAQQSIEKSIDLDPDFASSHRLLGVSLLRQTKKSEACKAFAKAKELGDPVVQKLIDDNCP